jgi:hypothetical protein
MSRRCVKSLLANFARLASNSKVMGRICRARAAVLVLLFAGGAAAREAGGAWPLVWDYAGRQDEPVASRLGIGGDRWVLSDSHLPGKPLAHSVLLRIARDGAVAWATADPEMWGATALALRDDGSSLALARVGGDLRITAFTAAGAIAWSRTRSGLAFDFPFSGPQSAPVWDEAGGTTGAWRIPAGLGGDFAVLSYAADGEALPDLLWSPPEGDGRVTSILPRAGGGLLVAGLVENDPPPGWWVVALDAAGLPEWSRFEDGETVAGAFSGAFLLSADPVRVWADDETHCGLFSLRVWALDAATGAPLWDATWPTNGFPGCESFTPDSVVLEGDRIVAAGVGNVASLPASFDPIAVAFDAASGELAWARSYAGATTGIRAEVSSRGGSALMAATLFPQPNPGPTRLWLASWDRDGDVCAAPFEILPGRVGASFAVEPGAWLVVGSSFSSSTGDDLVLQRAENPCAPLFADGFEAGDTSAWQLGFP